MRFFLLSIVTICFLSALGQIEIDANHHYQPSVVGNEFGVLENTADPDSGGVLTFFVINKHPAVDSIAQVWVMNVKGDTLKNKTWHYWWKPELGGVGSGIHQGAVVVKSQLSDFALGSTVRVSVLTAKGHYDSQSFVLTEPRLKIANILPDQILQQLWLYVRNDDTSTYEIQWLEINRTYYPAMSAVLQMVGGTELKAKQVKLIRYVAQKPFEPLQPLYLKIGVQKKGTSKEDTLVAFNRITPAEFTFGTWDSPLFNPATEAGRKKIRSLNIVAVHGPGNSTFMQNSYDEYHLKAIWHPSFHNLAATVKANENSDFVQYWSIDDEPDLYNKNIDTQLIKNRIYWHNDHNTPSYVNLCTQKKYQRYGWYSDIVSMDHYTDNGAPNVIPLSWITREGSPKEAIEYTEVLKRNTEPRRMRSWCQLAVKGTWKFQPEDYIINYQFWAHVMSGAKGIDFFCAKPSTPNDFPRQWNEAVRLVRQTNPIKNLLLYAEPLHTVKTRYADDVESRLLIGKDYAVLIILNDSIDYTPVNIINQEWRSDIWRKNFSVEFELPSWVNLQNTYEQTTAGKVPVQGLTSLGAGRYRLEGEVFKNSRVFVFAPNDTETPQKPERLIFSDVSSPNAYTLSWQEPHDNFGVKGYEIKADGQLFATVFHPILDATAAPNLCDFSVFEVLAFDEAGNKSLSASVPSPGFNGNTGNVAILNTLRDTSVQAGETVIFSVSDTLAPPKGYQWKYVENGIIHNIVDNHIYSGAFTPTLTIRTTPNENGKRYYCKLNLSCSDSAVSNLALLTVSGTLGIRGERNKPARIYPNPGTETCTVATNILGNYVVSVINYCGQELLRQPCAQPDCSLNVSHLPAGVYTFIISSENHYITQRWVKN